MEVELPYTPYVVRGIHHNTYQGYIPYVRYSTALACLDGLGTYVHYLYTLHCIPLLFISKPLERA